MANSTRSPLTSLRDRRALNSQILYHHKTMAMWKKEHNKPPEQRPEQGKVKVVDSYINREFCVADELN